MTENDARKNTHEVFALWRKEDREIEFQLDDLRTWMQRLSEQHVVDQGSPRYRETAARLKQFREYLLRHFDRENELSEQLCEVYGARCPEIESMRRQSARDHQQLLQQLNGLIEKLDMREPQFDSWHVVIEQVEWFVDAFEQHEDQESASISALLPAER